LFLAAKQKNKKSKAGHKKVKQKKMKRKWPGTGDKGSRALLKNSGSREQVQELTLGGCPQGAFLSLQLLEVLSDVGRQEHPTYRVLWRLVPVKT
jgi:hypothetical protein